MKRAWAFAMTLAVLMAGCGIKEEELFQPEPENSTSLTEAKTELPSENPPENKARNNSADNRSRQTTVSKPETTKAVQADTQPETLKKPDVDVFVDAYESALMNKIQQVQNSGSEDYIIDYTILPLDVPFDMPPVLAVSYGSCETDMQAAVYSYSLDHDVIVKIADTIPGQGIVFCGSSEKGQIVLAWVGDGSVQLQRYGRNKEEGYLEAFGEPEEFPYTGEEISDLDMILESYGAYRTFHFSSVKTGDKIVSYLYGGMGDYISVEQYDGLTFEELEEFLRGYCSGCTEKLYIPTMK